MGSWRVRGMCLTASVGVLAPHNDWPLSSAISLSGGTESTLSEFWRCDAVYGVELLARVGTCVDLGRLDAAVAKPEGHFSDVLCGLEDEHRTGMAQHMRRDSFGLERLAFLTGYPCVLGKDVCESPTAELLAFGIEEDLRDSRVSADSQPSPES